MPNKAVEIMFKRLGVLETKLEAHLEESGVIKTKLDVLMTMFWRLVAGGITFNVLLAIAVLTYLIRNK
jgi:hypothetical protein